MDLYQPVLNNMKKLGFSEYESKAYLKLLEQYPVNGYALSKSSGIPRSRIYEVLNKLLEKQMVFEQVEEKNTLYYPVDPEVFLKKIQSDYESLFTNISDYTEEVYRKHTLNESLVVINGRRNILDFIRLLIQGAERRIAISIWEEDVSDVEEEIKKAIESGVILRGMYFGDNPPFESLVPHRRLKRYFAEKNQRHIFIIVDESTVLSGIISKGDASKATWSHDEGFVEMGEDFIAHDLVVNLYSASLSEEKFKEFEEFCENVYHHYYHRSKEELKKYKKMI